MAPLTPEEYSYCHLLESENYIVRLESGEQDNIKNSMYFLAEWDVQQGVRCGQMYFIKGLRNCIYD